MYADITDLFWPSRVPCKDHLINGTIFSLKLEYQGRIQGFFSKGRLQVREQKAKTTTDSSKTQGVRHVRKLPKMEVATYSTLDPPLNMGTLEGACTDLHYNYRTYAL